MSPALPAARSRSGEKSALGLLPAPFCLPSAPYCLLTMVVKLLAYYLEDGILVKSRCLQYEDCRPSGLDLGNGCASRPRPMAWAGWDGPFEAQLRARRNAKLSMNIRGGAPTPKSIKMKVDSDKLMKTKREINDKVSDADELLKTNSLTKKPMAL